jgi:carboxylesterase type B
MPFLTGLFHRAIAMSGAVLNPWALVEAPRDRAFRLGAVLGCKTTDSKELVEFLRTVSARQLVEEVGKAQTPEVRFAP